MGYFPHTCTVTRSNIFPRTKKNLPFAISAAILYFVTTMSFAIVSSSGSSSIFLSLSAIFVNNNYTLINFSAMSKRKFSLKTLKIGQKNIFSKKKYFQHLIKTLKFLQKI